MCMTHGGYGHSSVGRAAVSKTAGRRFEPCCPCHPTGVECIETSLDFAVATAAGVSFGQRRRRRVGIRSAPLVPASLGCVRSTTGEAFRPMSCAVDKVDGRPGCRTSTVSAIQPDISLPGLFARPNEVLPCGRRLDVVTCGRHRFNSYRSPFSCSRTFDAGWLCHA